MISPEVGAAQGVELSRIYAEAEVRIIERIAALIAKGIDAPEWDSQVLAEIQVLRVEALEILEGIRPEAAATLRRMLDDAYAEGNLSVLQDAGAALTELEAPPGAQRAAVAALAGELAAGVTTAEAGILRNVDDVFRRVVGEVVGSTLTGAEFRKDAAQRALDRLVGDGLRGVQTKRGTLTLPDYVSMAVRTGVAKSAIQGHIDNAIAAGLPLGMIQPGPRTCKVCDRWARKIIALQGPAGPRRMETFALADAGKYLTIDVDATLDDARRGGWGHPNCRCAMGSYVPGISEPSELERPDWDAAGYAAQQQQRHLELEIRKAKNRQAATITPAAQAKARADVARRQAEMRKHLAEHPQLKRQSAREQVGRATGSRRPSPGVAR